MESFLFFCLLLSNLNIFLLAQSTITLTGNSYYTSLTNSGISNSNNVVVSYNLTENKESPSSGTSSSNPSSSSTGGAPQEIPGSDQREPRQSGTTQERPGSEQEEQKQSGTIIDKSESVKGETESETVKDKTNSAQEGQEQKGTANETAINITGSDHEEQKQSGIPQNNINNISSTIIFSSIINDTKDTKNETTDYIYNSSSIIETIINNIEVNNTLSQNQSSVVLLGYSHFEQKDKSFSFLIYFVSILNSVISKKLKFPINIQYNSLLRHLEIKDINCTLQESYSKIKLQYKCEAEADNSNIKQISIEPNFYFEGQDVNLAGITSLADEYMNKIKSVDELNYLNNSMIYILDHSIYNKINNSNIFNIYGEMNEQINFENNNLILKINSNSSQGNKEINASCVISNIKEKNYMLSCISDEEIKSDDLQSAYSKIDDNILLVNFDLQKDADIDTVEETEDTTGDETNSKKSSKGLSAGAIVGIVLASVVAVGAIVAVIIILKKGNKKKPMIKLEKSSNLQYSSEESN